MWKYALCQDVADRRFAAYKRKQRLLDKIAHELAPRADSIVFMGNSYDGAQHQGQRSGMHSPIKALLKHVGRKCRVIMVPEYRTTVSCFGCKDAVHQPMECVFDGKTGKCVDGTKYCARCAMCVNRDANASKNILCAGIQRIVSGIVPVALRWSRGEAAYFKSDPWRCLSSSSSFSTSKAGSIL